jgi:hypothetical protein
VERLIQYLDEIEDLFYVAPLIAEQVRRAIQRILFLLGSISLQIAGIVLALRHPPLALAIARLHWQLPHYCWSACSSGRS